MSRGQVSAAEIIERFGGVKALAELLQMSPSGINNWPERGIPRLRGLELLRLARERGVRLTEDELLSTTSRKNGAR